jgi:CubicO group peptidase (beta-lactamase class C family)
MVHGFCAPEFEPVASALETQLSQPDELGAAVAVIVDGEMVVDLWGGWADLARTRPWRAETLVNAYSVGKPFVALLLLQLVDQGAVGLDDPIADCWSAFGTSGKATVTVRHALCHQAGVPAIREPLTNEDLWDFDRMCAALAATEPWWPAGSRHAYHTNTFGHLVGGIARQLTGRLPGALLRDICAPLDADVHVGVPDSEHARCAEVHFDFPRIPSPPADHQSTLVPSQDGEAANGDAAAADVDRRMVWLSYSNPPGYSSFGVVNTPEWRRAQIPSTNGQMTAAGVARVYGAVLGGRLLSDELLTEATRPQSSGYCPVLEQDVTFGLGFQPWTANRPMGRSPKGYGHFGTGGSLGFADPAARVAFGYVTNHVIPRWQNPYNRALVDAVYIALG